MVGGSLFVAVDHYTYGIRVDYVDRAVELVAGQAAAVATWFVIPGGAPGGDTGLFYQCVDARSFQCTLGRGGAAGHFYAVAGQYADSAEPVEAQSRVFSANGAAGIQQCMVPALALGGKGTLAMADGGAKHYNNFNIYLGGLVVVSGSGGCFSRTLVLFHAVFFPVQQFLDWVYRAFPWGDCAIPGGGRIIPAVDGLVVGFACPPIV